MTELWLYNTLTRKKEKFRPLNSNQVNIYVCGLTVYDEMHLGHLRSALTFDLIVRWLEYKEYKVKYVFNFTDVDDKMIKRSKEENITISELARKYIDDYFEKAKMFSLRRADVYPRATEHIPEIIKLVARLIEKGFAYVVDGDVYFAVEKFKNYGKLSGQRLADLKAGARIEPDEKKRSPFDFALWKVTQPDDPAEARWDSPWGKGRPGWHIECSAMAMKYLGETLDIHGGGQDLIFPHHENEITQSESFSGKPFARYWLHNGMMTINGEKMAKSLGNFISLNDALKRYSAGVIRFCFLQTHYRMPLDFNWQKLAEAEQSLRRISTALGNAEFFLNKHPSSLVAADFSLRNEFKEVSRIKEKFISALDDDFNTSSALACVFELVELLNKAIEAKTIDLIDAGYRSLTWLGNLLGTFGGPDFTRGSLSRELSDLIRKREEARKSGDYATADKIREDLQQHGIIIEDTPEGPRILQE